MEDPILFLQNLSLALLLGGLIGLERERNHEREGVHDFGGIRTMSLVSTFAYVLYSYFFENTLIFAIFTLGFLALLVASYLMSSLVNKSIGATTEMAAMFVYFIGLMVGMGETLLAASITLIVLLLLHFKQSLHSFAYEVEKEEFYDTIKFIAVAFVVLPLLPNETFGPLDVLNPYLIWFVVVLITSISFVSYIAIKRLGPRKGIGLGGFLGGLVSSTAVSMSFSQLSKGSKKIVNSFVFGILIASSAMFFRILLEVSILNPDLLTLLWVPMVSMGGIGLLISVYFWSKKGPSAAKMDAKKLNLKSPFQLWPAIQFGIIFAVLIFAAKYANITFGEEGLYLTALVSGVVDVDAITVSMANLSFQGEISNMAAATSVTIAAMINTLVKGFIVLFFGSRAVGLRTFFSMLLIIAFGIISLLVFLPLIYGLT